jgi:hypothetical protein
LKKLIKIDCKRKIILLIFNKNRLQKEDNFENDNLSSIFNDESVFNNNKNTIQSNDINTQHSPTININILLN